MAENIFEEISNQAEQITDEDLEQWVLPSVMNAYDNKLKYLAYKAYGDKNQVHDLAVAAFKESAKDELRTALSTFFFKKEHWRNGRELDPYLRLCLNRLATRKSWDAGSIKIRNAPVCPLCRVSGRKEILTSENGMLKCKNCTETTERLAYEIKNGNADVYAQCKYNLHSKFALHSKKGCRCLECKRFIPKSLFDDNRVMCPYDDCIFSGNAIDIGPSTHPTVTFNDKSTESINKTSNNGSEEKSYTMSLPDPSASADALYDVKAQFENELSTLVTVIEEQYQRIKRTNPKSTATQKLFMYKAFQKMVERHPVEMVSYLVHREQKSDFPIQARIFQIYSQLIENNLPFTIVKRNREIDIVDLLSPDLALFNSICEFETEVDSNITIPNKTKEEYIGGRGFKRYGPLFLGKIIDIVDIEKGESILEKMVEFSFSRIKMENVEPNTKVKVTHFSILSHYEMDSLVFLQRARKDIVNSIYFRLHNKKRKTGK